jgi:predicted glycosyltransferase
MTIWIDLDNSPHVPFFAPIIKELHSRGYSLLVTARDCFQVCDLARLLGVEYKRIGRHFGKKKFLKVIGLGIRALQLAPTVLRHKPDLAISHGSRAQLLLSALVGIPSMVIMDYEFARGLVLTKPNWVMVPEILPEAAVQYNRTRILKYPGIKEDVYAARFTPDPTLKRYLDIKRDDIVVTVRPPATEAHYHVSESDGMFHAVIDLLSDKTDVKVVLLPRNKKQEEFALTQWPDLFKSGRLMIPDHAVDGINLVWHSDLVISGGGTMNREAASLGVPVYSIFRGKIGAVDQFLADNGRLALLKSVEDIRTKIVLKQRCRTGTPERANHDTLLTIVDHIVSKASTLNIHRN